MKSYRYLQYILRHKWYVAVNGRKLGVPLWQLLTHNLSKFSITEWSAYIKRFYPEKELTEKPAAFDYAWLKHQKHNKHHWQHWVLISDHGVIKPLKMPRKYALEMIADWTGANHAIIGSPDCKEWYENNKQYMLLHPETRNLVENIILGKH